MHRKGKQRALVWVGLPSRQSLRSKPKGWGPNAFLGQKSGEFKKLSQVSRLHGNGGVRFGACVMDYRRDRILRRSKAGTFDGLRVDACQVVGAAVETHLKLVCRPRVGSVPIPFGSLATRAHP